MGHPHRQTTSISSGHASVAGGLPLRILELRSADGEGGGPEKTIMNGARLSSPEEFEIHIVYLKPAADTSTMLQERAHSLGLRYSELAGRGPLDLSQLKALRQYVEQHRIQLVHSHEYKSNLFAWLLARKSGLALLSTAHGWTGDSFRERRLYYPADRRLLRRFPAIISVSSEITRTLVGAGVPKQRIHTIPNAIDGQAFAVDRLTGQKFRQRLGIGPDDIVIGGAGRLAPQKRFDLLLDACHEVSRQTGRPLRVVIAGEGQLRQPLQEQINRLGAADRFLLAGHVSDIREFFSGIDLFVQASDYEGTSNAVLEAMAMNAPVVATRAGGTEDLVEHGVHARLVPVGEPEPLVAAIRDSLEQAATTAGQVEAARQRIENELGFANRNRRLESVYRDLLQEKSGD